MNPQKTALLGLATATAIAAALAPTAARAGSAYDNCTGTIAALPAVINSRGTWCLKDDLNSALASGVAITVNAANVTIDCNDFKLNGTPAGVATQTLGIATTAPNLTVRRCHIRGFLHGTSVMGKSATIEDNRFDVNREAAIWSDADGHIIRRNLITASGGTPSSLYGYGIYMYGTGDVIDNTIVGVTNAENEGVTTGIEILDNQGGSISGNRIRGLTAPDIGGGSAIHAGYNSNGLTIKDNDIYIGPDLYFGGIRCDQGADNGVARDNTIQGNPNVSFDCYDGGGNVYLGPP
jgi:hypothetical protein